MRLELAMLCCAVAMPSATVLDTALSVRANPVALTDSLLRSHDFSGIAIVSRRGTSLFRRAYGKANIEYDVDVRLDTPFRIGSISKLFTWTAVMQLVEQGKVDLDADVNRYLDFKIPKTNAASSTPLELLVPGLEGQVIGIVVP